MKIGYARVSTTDQNLDLQRNALNEAGCDRIFEELISGSKKERPELNKMVDILREGDQVIIWKPDRLGRSLKNLIEIIELFNSRSLSKVYFRNTGVFFNVNFYVCVPFQEHPEKP